ncbi:unnamed protein product [Zymoseptoria tritici ST99CH_3D7]|uniref:F-box domain-containing protein n=1 Tax=Zymoseptoria tritici (strain ST99CH_3D7) TaxID=1276538 RepID=A0A1X7S9D6_ZYMT9|nr:unnamed protein product [Zymoseptoria tritici ST99CH_3D7]
MEQSASLTGLPVEMLELVARHTGKDMKKLRLVSRHIADGTLTIFKRTFFSDVKVLIATKSSMEKAIQIVESTNLGPAVRRLTLTDDSVLGDPEAWDSTAIMVKLDAQRKLRENGEDTKLLTELFRKCKRHASLSTIRIKAFVEGEDGPYRGEPDFMDGNDDAFVAVMRAIVLSGASFDTLLMDTLAVDGDDHGIDNFAGLRVIEIGQNDHHRIASAAALHRFNTLDLILQAGYEDTEDIGQNLLAMIPHTKVRSLKIRPEFDSGDAIDNCSNFVIGALLELDFPAMETLILRRAVVSWTSFAPFIKRQKSLRHIDLFHVGVNHVPVEVCHMLSADGNLDNNSVRERLSQLAGVVRVEVSSCRFSNHIVQSWW